MHSSWPGSAMQGGGPDWSEATERAADAADPADAAQAPDAALIERYRAALGARRRRLAQQLSLAGATGAVLGFALVLLGSAWVARQLDAVQRLNAPMREQLEGMRRRDAQASAVQARIGEFRQRATMLLALRQQAGTLAQQLSAVSQAAPAQLVPTRMTQAGSSLLIHGTAASERQVALWLRALHGIPGLAAALLESKAGDGKGSEAGATAFAVRLDGLALLPGGPAAEGAQPDGAGDVGGGGAGGGGVGGGEGGVGDVGVELAGGHGN